MVLESCFPKFHLIQPLQDLGIMQSFHLYAYFILDLGIGLFCGIFLVPFIAFFEFGELQNHMNELIDFWTCLVMEKL